MTALNPDTFTVRQKALLDQVEQLAGDITGIVDTLYHAPEVGLQERRAMAHLTGILSREGFGVEPGVAGLETSFRATVGQGAPRVALLAEMDALPGLGHACGHNIIAAAAVGAGCALSRVIGQREGTILVLGTPAEEQGIGKVAMVRAGLFDGIECALMVHPSSKRQVLKHYLGLVKVRLTFLGRPAHAAAYPEEGVNALDAVIQTFTAVNALRQQLRQDVRLHGIITEGGVAPNIIPARGACFFYVRADDLEEVAAVRQRLLACAEGAARATGCSLEVEEEGNVLAPLKINHTLSAVYSRQLALLGLPESTAPADRNKGSSDIGNVSQVVPTIHPHVPIGQGVHIHTEEFARATISAAGHQAALEGARALALTVLALLEEPALCRTLRAEFDGEMTASLAMDKVRGILS
jgi:amidohydrolase